MSVVPKNLPLTMRIWDGDMRQACELAGKEALLWV